MKKLPAPPEPEQGEFFADLDDISSAITRALRRHPIHDLNSYEGSAAHAYIASMIFTDSLIGEAIEIHPASNYSFVVGAVAWGMADAILERIAAEFQWTHDQYERAEDALSRRPRKFICTTQVDGDECQDCEIVTTSRDELGYRCEACQRHFAVAEDNVETTA
jgi:hypothetical protein